VIQAIAEATFAEVVEGQLPSSSRGLGGFGHSGR
jgi:dUTPase